jgi:hypothetical protein
LNKRFKKPFKKKKRFAEQKSVESVLSSRQLNFSQTQTKTAVEEWQKESEYLRNNPVTSQHELDPWQQEVFDALIAGKNVIVDAPTTAGKTRAVEMFFEKHVTERGFRAAYTTPVKSLANDKLFEFRERFGEKSVGIATGDVKENLNAQIVVTTLETYRNSLIGIEPDLARSLVVFDEYHYIQDGSRGSGWEEAIILTPQGCSLLLLSASVENAEEFVSWLTKIHPHRETVLIRTLHRPVPLEHMVYIDGEWLLASSLEDRVLKKEQGGRKLPTPIRADNLSARLCSVEELHLLPCIIYTGRRKGCDLIAVELCRALEPLPPERAKNLRQMILAEPGFKMMDDRFRKMLTEFGVSVHHSGLPGPIRIVVEKLLKKGELRFCVATMGLSLGINFSVKSALIADYMRPDETGFVKYTASEVMQMLGRAGRRGRDVVGVGLWSSLDSFLTLRPTKRESCYSRLRNDPTTFLGLISQGRNIRELERFYNSSFLRFKDKKTDLSFATKDRILKKLQIEDTPCVSPAHSFANHFHGGVLCRSCPHQKPCHRYMQQKCQSDLAGMHVHLHYIQALDENLKLTPYGDIAKHFPHGGGLYIAKLLLSKPPVADLIQIMASLAVAAFKDIEVPETYRFPYKEQDVLRSLEEYYPADLFPECYEPAQYSQDELKFRDFNPNAGYAILAWFQGENFAKLEQEVCTTNFAAGDLMNLIYRVASYVQALNGTRLPEYTEVAISIRNELLRPPLSVTI